MEAAEQWQVGCESKILTKIFPRQENKVREEKKERKKLIENAL